MRSFKRKHYLEAFKKPVILCAVDQKMSFHKVSKELVISQPTFK